jgi:hypothetical protein
MGVALSGIGAKRFFGLGFKLEELKPQGLP